MLEKRFERDKKFHNDYLEFMREFERLEHISQVNYNQEPSNKMVYHIPHHGVYSSNKFRVVLDASCKTDRNISLNEVQLVGEKLQRDLTETTMRVCDRAILF